MVQSKTSGGRFLEHTLVRKARERAVERIAIAARRRGKRVNLVHAGGDMVRDTQCRHHVNEPGSAEITQRFESCGFLFWHTSDILSLSRIFAHIFVTFLPN